MATKADYKAVYTLILQILEADEISAEKRVEMIKTAIKETLDEKPNAKKND